MVNGIENYEFQENCVDFLYDKTTASGTKQIVTVKAPTGAGKTVILVKYVDTYLKNTDGKTAFIWLCPGKGNLEEQSKDRMDALAPHIDTRSLPYSMLCGFEGRSVTFINWELVTRKKNNALKDGERKNLFEKIEEAHQDGIKFIVIIDEEHENNTSKANDIIEAFKPIHIIRVSATPIKVPHQEFYEIPEEEVIDAGLITRAIYVNEGVEDSERIEDDYDILLKLADSKRQEILAAYEQIGVDIRPLVLIQFPVGQPETIKAVEDKLASMGYTYDNGMVSKWMSEDKKDLPDNLTENDAIPVFLLMKQAISTGWDCPRAKILVKLREGMSESFEIQTIGRIRRMPEAKHYEDDLLDFCYVYTFDEKYKAGLLSNMDKAYETRRLFLKEKCKTFTLEKEIRDLDVGSLGERNVLNKIYDALVRKYNLSTSTTDNKLRFMAAGYQFGDEIIGHALYGEYVRTDMVAESTTYYTTRKLVNTHKHGIELLHSVDAIKSTIGMQSAKVKIILERLFRMGGSSYKKLLLLDTSEFYAFIINNEHRLKEEFREVTAGMNTQMTLPLNPKKSIFHIPEQDFYKYDPGVKNEVEYLTNAYHDYTSGYATNLVRSTSEMLFEQFCESRDDIEWVYKNGDTGQQYFSIVYRDGLQNQWLFYADYIIMKKDSTVWVIETKGGETKGKDKNIDIQIENKFNAFKNYAAEHSLHWGFVRDKDNQLYINNTEFAHDMSDDHWVPLSQEF